MFPKKFTELIDGLEDKEAAKKLYVKFIELHGLADYSRNDLYMTKIAYYVDKETQVARLVFTNLIGNQSYTVMSGDMEKFVSEAHKLEDGTGVVVYAVTLKSHLEPFESDLLLAYNEYCEKKIAKDEAKKLSKVKYEIGDVVILKSKIRNGSKKNVKKFIVKKIIWSIHSSPVNILVLKQIEGPVNNLSMTAADCKKYHIKYEENLQVYSMFMNFVKIK